MCILWVSRVQREVAVARVGQAVPPQLVAGSHAQSAQRARGVVTLLAVRAAHPQLRLTRLAFLALLALLLARFEIEHDEAGLP